MFYEEPKHETGVIYARFSSSKQHEQSIEDQVKFCTEWAKGQGIKIIKIYADRAKSGKEATKRKEFQKMIKESSSKQFDCVIVWKHDRFARNRIETGHFKYLLKQNGVRVLSATETNDSPIIEAIHEAMAEEYIKGLSENVTRGMTSTAHKGTSNGGTVPYGYKVVNKEFVVEPKEAKIVLEIFTLYADGTSKKEICDILNNRGIKTRTGSKWGINSFSRILKNRKYLGIYTWNDIEVPDRIPKIINQSLFNSVQCRINANKHHSGRDGNVEYLLRGKAFCGHCGAPLVGTSGKASYFYYSCASRKKYQDCDKKHESKQWLEDYVVDTTLEYISDETKLDAIATNVVKEYNMRFETEEFKKTSSQLKKLREKQDDLKEKMQMVETKEAMKALEGIYKEVSDKIVPLKQKIQKITLGKFFEITEEDVKDWLHLFQYGDRNDIEFRKRVINSLVNSVYVYDDKIGLYYNIKNSDMVTYEENQNAVEEVLSRSKSSSRGSPNYTLYELLRCFSFFSEKCGSIKIRETV